MTGVGTGFRLVTWSSGVLSADGSASFAIQVSSTAGSFTPVDSLFAFNATAPLAAGACTSSLRSSGMRRVTFRRLLPVQRLLAKRATSASLALVIGSNRGRLGSSKRPGVRISPAPSSNSKAELIVPRRSASPPLPNAGSWSGAGSITLPIGAIGSAPWRNGLSARLGTKT
jgi:hypothetical protein